MCRKRTIIIFSLNIAHDIQYTLKGKCTEIARTYISVWHKVIVWKLKMSTQYTILKCISVVILT